MKKTFLALFILIFVFVSMPRAQAIDLHTRIRGGDSYATAVTITPGTYQFEDHIKYHEFQYFKLMMTRDAQVGISLQNIEETIQYNEGVFVVGVDYLNPQSQLSFMTPDQGRIETISAQGRNNLAIKYITALNGGFGERGNPTGFRGFKASSDSSYIYLKIGNDFDNNHISFSRDTILNIVDPSFGTPTPTPTPVSSPTPTATPIPIQTPTPMPTPTHVFSPTPTPALQQVGQVQTGSNNNMLLIAGVVALMAVVAYITVVNRKVAMEVFGSYTTIQKASRLTPSKENWTRVAIILLVAAFIVVFIILIQDIARSSASIEIGFSESDMHKSMSMIEMARTLLSR